MVKVSEAHVMDVLGDLLADGIDILCKDYGIEYIDWAYPYEGDSSYHFEEFCKAIAEGIQTTVNWEEYDRADD